MYMRIVQGKYQPDALSKIQQIYDEEIIPRLNQTEGCLSVNLIESDIHENELMSMTLWKTKAHAEAYEKSGVYQELLHKVIPYLTNSSEWKIQLSKDLTLEYQPATEEPVVLKTYSTAAKMDKKIPPPDESRAMHMRILSVNIQPGQMEEFKQVYTDEILLTLKDIKGCHYAFMTTNAEEENEVLCVTVWDSKQDADAYEKIGLFEMLKKKVEHTFSGLYRWKMALEKESDGHVVTSDDLQVDTYHVVTGKSFQQS